MKIKRAMMGRNNAMAGVGDRNRLAITNVNRVDYEETYSLVVDESQISNSLANVERLQMRFMNVATTYLYGSLDSDIYMKIPEGLKILEALYVDDLNIIGNLDEIEHTANLLKNKFEMKDLVGYADTGYLSDPHKARSQTGYVFTYGDTAISWRSTKQSFTATSSNHAELIALYEAGRECVWLRSLIKHIQEECGLESIKGDKTKHISLKFFFTYDLQKDGVIDVCQVRSSDNLTDFFTKSLPTKVFELLVKKTGL
ncbi:hypothetical protein Tco_0798506 [Tanacetum coccineum]